MNISKEAELFEKANIVDVGLQPNEFRPRRNSGSASKYEDQAMKEALNELRQNLEKIDVNNDDSDDIKLSIDEVDKADNNLVVDEAFQKLLNERADQFAGGDQSNLDSFPSIPKPTVGYAYTDRFEDSIVLREWFTAKEWSNLSLSSSLFVERFGDAFSSLDSNEKEDVVLELIEFPKDDKRRLNNLICLTHIALGSSNDDTFNIDMEMIGKNVDFLINLGVTPWLVDQLKTHFDASSKIRYNLEISSQCLFHCCTILYSIVVRSLSKRSSKAKDQLSELGLLDLLMKFIDAWRWNSRNSMRIRNIIVLLSRSIQLIIGDLESREQSKDYLSQKYCIVKNEDSNKLKASPVDFHVFRNELTSRYPSFIPPPSKLPEGFEQASSLAQFINTQKTADTRNQPIQDPPQGIHISTPAPSPSSSPMKTAKNKRAFQTNQSYPFLYPTGQLEESIPKSVQEATDLFVSSIRYSLSLKQLWSEIGSFVEQERGWIESSDGSFNQDFDYSHDNDETYRDEIKSLLEVEKFYDHNLPYFSSLSHVLLQIIISTQEDHALIMKKNNNQNTVEMIRLKEIVMKESSLILVLLLKWFKINHVLKFENFCTIIYDSNYLGIINQYLKSLGNEIINRIENPVSSEESSIDLNFCFTLSNLLTITSKITTKRVQRVLTLCENDIPTSLRNIFEFYNLEIWHPALKILKEITPFKGKKWKSNNMDLISMVYLHQKLGLRDNWLSGRDIDSEISDAYGQEIALRALVQFYNIKRYPVSMGQLGYKEKAGDFFTRESEVVTRN